MKRIIAVILAVGCTAGFLWTSHQSSAAQKMVLTQVVTAKKFQKLRGPIYLANATGSTVWTMPNLCAAYQFPRNMKGGAVIGIAEFGGGYTKTDLALFSRTYMNNVPINVIDVSVDGTVNSPNVDPGVDAEVALDIQIAAAAYYYCTGQAPTIKVFFCDSGTTTDAFIANNTKVITAAANAGCDVLSISWGTDEHFVSLSVANALETAATAATAKGMAIFASAGDGNSTNERQGETDGLNHVSLPASAPHIIAVGGTTKTLTTETVWNNGFSLGTPYPLGTGGGYSQYFPAQSFQIGAPKAPITNNGLGRMVPDVAANADPLTPYNIALQGIIQAAGNGTSAASPLWAGLVASVGTKLGNANPKLWLTANRTIGFTDIKVGNNGGFAAAVGPDACTGLGVPIGTGINTVFQVAPVVPPPTPSNVTVAYSAGTLTITGDTKANVITVTLQAGILKVEGAAATSVNTKPSFTTPHSGLLVLNVDMGDGDDGISVSGVQSSTSNVKLGAGADKAAFTLCNIKTLAIDGGAGTDVLLTTSSTITTLSATNIP